MIEHRRLRRERHADGAAPAEIEDRQVRIKLHDKVAALGMAAKCLGLFRDRRNEPERPLKGRRKAKRVGVGAQTLLL